MQKLSNPSVSMKIVRSTARNLVRKIMENTNQSKKGIRDVLVDRENNLQGLFSRYRSERTATKRFARASRQRNRK